METLLLLAVVVVGSYLLFPEGVQALTDALAFPFLPVLAQGLKVTQDFHPGHSGIDFRAPIGSPLFNVAPGRVINVDVAGRGASGRFVIVEGRDRFSSVAWSYSHMSQIDVVIGQELLPGDLVGLSGNTGTTTGPHLHFAVLARAGLRFVDPRPFVSDLIAQAAQGG